MGLPFFAADTLGMTLFQIDGNLEATEIRKLAFGPWRVDFKINAQSDIMNGKEISFWLKMAALRMYVIIREQEAWLVVIGPHDGKFTGYNPVVTVQERLVQMRPAIKGMFHYSKDTWTQIAEQNWP